MIPPHSFKQILFVFCSNKYSMKATVFFLSFLLYGSDEKKETDLEAVQHLNAGLTKEAQIFFYLAVYTRYQKTFFLASNRLHLFALSKNIS